MLLEESAHGRGVPRITRRATVRILGAMARSAEPVQDAAWNATVLRHLQDIAASLHFYSSPALTKHICRGEHADWLSVSTWHMLGRISVPACSSALQGITHESCTRYTEAISVQVSPDSFGYWGLSEVQ